MSLSPSFPLHVFPCSEVQLLKGSQRDVLEVPAVCFSNDTMPAPVMVHKAQFAPCRLPQQAVVLTLSIRVSN